MLFLLFLTPFDHFWPLLTPFDLFLTCFWPPSGSWILFSPLFTSWDFPCYCLLRSGYYFILLLSIGDFYWHACSLVLIFLHSYLITIVIVLGSSRGLCFWVIKLGVGSCGLWDSGLRTCFWWFWRCFCLQQDPGSIFYTFWDFPAPTLLSLSTILYYLLRTSTDLLLHPAAFLLDHYCHYTARQ